MATTTTLTSHNNLVLNGDDNINAATTAGRSSASDADKMDAAERKRQEAMNALIEIEADLAALKNRIYQDKIAELDQEVKTVKDGTHQALQPFLKSLQRRQQQQVDQAAVSFRHKEQFYIRQWEDAVDHVNKTFVLQVKRLREDMIAEVSNQQGRLMSERQKLYASGSRERPVSTKRRKVKRLECMEWEMMLADEYFPSSVVSGLSAQKVMEDLTLLQSIHQ